MSNEINEVKAEIDAIKLVLISHGPVFSGGDQQTAEHIAREWHDCGFGSVRVGMWCEVGCWTPSVAEDFRAARMTPSSAAKACQMHDDLHGGDSMYAACNADIATADIIEVYAAS